jgi:hypothetical protein
MRPGLGSFCIFCVVRRGAVRIAWFGLVRGCIRQ